MATSAATVVGRQWSPFDPGWDHSNTPISRSLHNEEWSRVHSSPSEPRDALNWLMLNGTADHPSVAMKSHELDSDTPERNLSPHPMESPISESSSPIVSPTARIIPVHYVKTITEAFGRNADLYDDVLKVARDSNPRDLRIAYFRRGREVLSEGETRKPSEAATVGGSLSNMCKKRFQAVSMAYEILGNNEWKQEYDECGLLELNDPLVKDLSPKGVGSPIIRRSSSLERPRSRGKNGVRWCEEVEELVFDQHPAEMPGNRGRSRKSRKPKKQIVAEGGLERHLEMLDKQADKLFVFDFLDDIEASIDELISIGSLKKAKVGSKEILSPSTLLTKTDPEKISPPEQEMLDDHPDPTADISPPDETQRPTSGKVKKAAYNFEIPPDLIPSTPSKVALDCTDSANTTDDTVSTLTNTISEKRVWNAPKSDGLQMESVVEEETVENSRDVPSETLLSTAIVAPDLDKPSESDGCNEACDSDAWCGSDDASYSTSCGKNNTAETEVSNDMSRPMGQKKVKTGTAEFQIFLVTYLKSLVDHINQWGTPCQDMDFATVASQAMQSMMISDGDLEGMISILRTEMDQSVV